MLNTGCLAIWQKNIIYHREGLKFGNIHKNSLKDIWLSEAAKTMRQHHIQNGRKGKSPCTDCEVHGQVYGEKSFNLFKKYYA